MADVETIIDAEEARLRTVYANGFTQTCARLALAIEEASKDGRTDFIFECHNLTKQVREKVVTTLAKKGYSIVMEGSFRLMIVSWGPRLAVVEPLT